MLNKPEIKLILLFAVVSLFALGCAKKDAVNVASEEDARPAPKPFDAPQIGAGGSSSAGIVLSDADEKLVIPGSKFGKAPSFKERSVKKKKKGKSSPKNIPFSDGIADQMEGLMWGMSYKKVLSLFEYRLKETFEADLKASTGDALAEDKIRTRMLREISKLRKSHIKFDGQRTGYESHLIADDITHNNGESILVWDAGKYVEYLFFFNNRFWKRIRSFRVDSFSSKLTFDNFLASIEEHFGGPGKDIFDDKGKVEKVAWHDEESYAYVMDRSSFFGIYALKFTAALSEKYLSELRPNKDRAKGKVSEEISNMVDSVTTMQGDLSDHQSSVIDGYTGVETGDPGSATPNASHSVTDQYNKKKKKKDAAKPKENNSEGSSNDIDDLF